MENQVLVAYATKYDATGEIAEKIGEKLKEAGLTADVKAADQVSDLSAYQAVVLGSAVYAGQWRKEAAEFLQTNERALAERPVWSIFQQTAWRGRSSGIDERLALSRGAAAHR